MRVSKPFCSLDDVFSNAFTGCVDVTSTPFLTETGSTARIDDEYYVAEGIPIVCRIMAATAETTRCRRATTIVMHNHRILLVRVKVSWKVGMASEFISVLALEAPCFASTDLDFSHHVLVDVADFSHLLVLGVERIEAWCYASSAAVIYQCGTIIGEIAAADDFARLLYSLYLVGLHVETVETYGVSILGSEIYI